MKVQKTNNQQTFGMAVDPKVKNMIAGEIDLIERHSDLLNETYSGLLARISVKDEDWRKFVFRVSAFPRNAWDSFTQFLGFGVVKTPSGNMSGAKVGEKLLDDKFVSVVKEAKEAYLKDPGVVKRSQRAKAKSDIAKAADTEKTSRKLALERLRDKYPDV